MFMNNEEIPPDTPPYARKKIQTAMNYTRNKLKKGKFNVDEFEVVSVEIESDKIDSAFDNYTIIQLTDIHLGQWITKEKLMGIVELINKENADLIVLTGDYVSYKVDDCLDDLEEALKHLKAEDAILSVLGNHDHWINPVKVKHSLERCNIINLENEVYTIYKDGSKLQIAGVDSITYDKDDINQVMERIDENSPAIMLAHEPDFADITSRYDPFILQLSGHSHGCQISIPKIGTPIRGKNFLKYPSGEYKVNEMIQYTSRGIGTNAFWLRINCPPEITKIILKKV